MPRRHFWLILVIGSLVVLSGCASRNTAGDNQGGEVPETGVVIEVSQPGTIAQAVHLGDVVHLTLSGEGGSGRQWVAVAPTSSTVLILKEQKVTNLTTVNASSTWEWWFKVTGAGNEVLRFEYRRFDESAVETYELTIGGS